MITRYEEKTDSLFICINSDVKPVYIEHFFTEEERATDKSRKETIERLMAELEIKEEDYIKPEKAVLKVEEARAYVLDNKNIATAKTSILTEKLEVINEAEIEENILKD